MDSVSLFKKYKIPEPKAFSSETCIYIAVPQSDLRLIIAHQLEKLGFSKIKKGRDGRDVIIDLGKEAAEILIAADDLPSISPLELAKELRESPLIKKGSVVLVSNPLNKGEVMLALESGINEFFIRPVVPADILPKLRLAHANYINKKNPERLYEHAKNKLNDESFEESYAIYKDLSGLNSNIARPFVGMARVHLAKGELQAALSMLDLALEKNKYFVHAYVIRAEIYCKMDKNDDAIKDLKKAVEISPLNVPRLESVCEFLIPLTQYDACIEILDNSVKAGLSHPIITERLGFCYFRKKDYIMALGYLKEAIRLDPNNVSFLNSLAICYRDNKNYDEALSAYNQILKRDNDNYQVMFNKALVLVYRGDKIEAIKLLTRIIKLQPDYTRAQEKLVELEKAS